MPLLNLEASSKDHFADEDSMTLNASKYQYEEQ